MCPANSQVSPSQIASKTRPGALKHGLTARRYVTPEQAERVVVIRVDLLRAHAPETDEEMQLVDRLAVELARLYDAERALDERHRWQRVHAEELFDRRNREQFHADLQSWRKSVAVGTFDFFGKTWHSAAWLKALWESVREFLKHGTPISYDQIKDIIMALGGDWHVDRIWGRHRQVMSLFLAESTDPETALATWVADCRGDTDALGALADPATFLAARDTLAKGRARWFLADAATVETARANLKTIAEVQSAFWTGETERLRGIYLKEQARSNLHGLEQGDSAHSRESLRILRYAVTTQNRVDRLERRLLALRKMRPLNQMRGKGRSFEGQFAVERQAYEPIGLPEDAGAIESSEPAADETGPASEFAAASHGAVQDACPADPEIPQVNDSYDDATILQNDGLVTVQTVSETSPPARKAARRDAKELVRQFRRQGKNGFRRSAKA